MLNNDVKGALVDAYVAAYYHTLFEHQLLRLNSIYDIPTAQGLVLAGNTKKIEKCMVRYMSGNRGWISHHIAENAQTLKVSFLFYRLNQLFYYHYLFAFLSFNDNHLN